MIRALAIAAAVSVAAVASVAGVTAWADETIVNPPPGFEPSGSLTNGADSRCLSVDPGTMETNGSIVRLRNCQYLADQAWEFRAARPDQNVVNGIVVQIVSRASGLCLDADNGTLPYDRSQTHAEYRSTGTILQLWECNGWNNQAWIVLNTATDSAAPVDGVPSFAQNKFEIRSLITVDPGLRSSDNVPLILALSPDLNRNAANNRPGEVNDYSANANFLWDSPELQCRTAGLGRARYLTGVPVPPIRYACG